MKKLVKLIVINLLVLIALLVLIDPFLAKKKESDGATFRSLHMREFGPNRTLLLDATTFPDNEGDTLDHQFYHITTDNNGFIIGPNDRMDAQPDIIFFGGSTTECAFVDDSLRFPYLVQNKLREKLQANFVVRNAGYGGNHTMHSVVNLIGNGIIHKPQVVVLMHNSNDLSQLSKTGTYWQAPGNRALLIKNFLSGKKSWKQKLKDWRNASLALFIPNIFDKLYTFKRKQERADEWKGLRSASFIGLESIERQYRDALKTFVSIAKVQGIQVVIMTQFNRLRLEDKKVRREYTSVQNPITYEEYVQYYAKLSQVIREVAASENIPLIDLDKTVPKNGTMMMDAVHLNNAGSRLVANVVADSLVNFLTKEN